jgi:hypothetical protein
MFQGHCAGIINILTCRLYGCTVLFEGCFRLWEGSVCSVSAYYSDSSKSFSDAATACAAACVWGEESSLCWSFGLWLTSTDFSLALSLLIVLSVRMTELGKKYFSFYHGIESHSILWLHKSLSTR